MFLNLLAKLLRATGGCLGINRRRRTCLPTIIFGELEESIDPEDSEWGNPKSISSLSAAEYIGCERRDPLN
jgi:hypothetical protein